MHLAPQLLPFVIPLEWQSFPDPVFSGFLFVNRWHGCLVGRESPPWHSTELTGWCDEKPDWHMGAGLPKESCSLTFPYNPVLLPRLCQHTWSHSWRTVLGWILSIPWVSDNFVSSCVSSTGMWQGGLGGSAIQPAIMLEVKVDLAFNRQKGDHCQHTEHCQSWKVFWKKESDTGSLSYACRVSIHVVRSSEFGSVEHGRPTLSMEFMVPFKARHGIQSAHIYYFPKPVLTASVPGQSKSYIYANVCSNCVQTMTVFNEWRYVTLKYMHKGTWDCWTGSFTSHPDKKSLRGQSSTTNSNCFLKITFFLPLF